MEIFKYGEKEIEYLKGQDKILGEAMERIGRIERRVIPNLFEALINSIVGQQISAKAAETVWNRLKDMLKEITPESIATGSVEEIQSCGLSTRKASYIKSAGEAVYKRELILEEFSSLSEEEIIKRLSSLKGVGVWTAEMLMIFSMERTDIVSYGDLAILRGMMRLYELDSLPKELFDSYRKKYSPYGSVASLYLWAISKD